jgi:adhesin transport system outer membrane protein
VKTSNAFVDVIKFQAKLEAANESILEHSRLINLIQHRTEREVSSENELVLARSRLTFAKNERIQFQNSLINSVADLEQLTGKRNLKIKPPPVVFPSIKSLDLIVQSAFEIAPTIKKSEQDIKSAESEIDIKQSVLWPQLSARVEEYMGGTYPSNLSYIALTFNPGNGLSALSGANEAKAKLNSATEAIEVSKKDLIDKIRSDYNLYQTSTNQEEGLPPSTHLLDLTQG